MVVDKLLSLRTNVHPAGAVMATWPRIETTATSTSPATAPTGSGADAAVPLAADVVAAPWNPGTPTTTPGVVTPTGADDPDTFPAASNATTAYSYDVEAANPVSVNDVPVTVATTTDCRSTR